LELAAGEGAGEEAERHAEDRVGHRDRDHGDGVRRSVETEHGERVGGNEARLRRAQRGEGQSITGQQAGLASGLAISRSLE
jgi:hypothetical protein